MWKIVEPNYIGFTMSRVIGQSTGFPKFRANLVVDKTVTFNPVVESSPPTNYFAPMPSNSFSNISHIEKVIDPLDPLTFNRNRHIYLTIDSMGESEERRRDADYSPSFSCRATSDSDLSIIEPYYRGSNNNNNARSNNNVHTNLNNQARRWASEGPPTVQLSCKYWVTQKLPQIYTANHETFPIQIRKITVQICGNFWVTPSTFSYISKSDIISFRFIICREWRGLPDSRAAAA